MSEFTFGSDKIDTKRGGKAKDDYLIFYNDVQIDDKEIFKGILINTLNGKDAKTFIECFTKCNSIKLNKKRIETVPSPLKKDRIYTYCINSKLNTELQKFLFISILRCDIDNICYCPPLNGCIRFFIQILLLLSYKFKWTLYINKNDIPADIVKYIYEIGFKKSRIDFKEIYERYLKEGI